MLSAVALPIGDNRDPYGNTINGGSSSIDGDDDDGNAYVKRNFLDLILIGVALLVLGIVLYMHFRLRKEYDLMSKDKSSLAQTTQSLKKLWNKVKNAVPSVVKDAVGANSGDMAMSGLTREQLEEELRLAQTGLMAMDKDADALLDDELEEHGFISDH